MECAAARSGAGIAMSSGWAAAWALTSASALANVAASPLRKIAFASIKLDCDFGVASALS